MIKPKTSFINLLSDNSSDRSGSSKSTCKFVIIRHEDQLVLVLGHVAEYPYHANLVYNYCQSNDISAIWEKKPDLVTIFQKKTSVQGGGWIEIEPESGILKIFGKSTAYGDYDSEELKLIVDSEPFFDRFEIQINS